MTCGLSFLETSCNPYILSMGTEETSTRRLNFAQCFNPIGSLMGMYIGNKASLHKVFYIHSHGQRLLDEFRL